MFAINFLHISGGIWRSATSYSTTRKRQDASYDTEIWYFICQNLSSSLGATREQVNRQATHIQTSKIITLLSLSRSRVKSIKVNVFYLLKSQVSYLIGSTPANLNSILSSLKPEPKNLKQNYDFHRKNIAP